MSRRFKVGEIVWTKYLWSITDLEVSAVDKEEGVYDLATCTVDIQRRDSEVFQTKQEAIEHFSWR